MKRPSFQFYPDDWLSDVALRACSPCARGIWMDVLCLMHQSAIYGHLPPHLLKQNSSKDEANDQANPKQHLVDCQKLARMVGATQAEVEEAISEFVANEVCSVDETGGIFSRRMERDEYIRSIRAAAGSQGGKTRVKNAFPDSTGGGLLEQKPSKESSKQQAILQASGKQTLKQKPTPSSSSSSSSSSSEDLKNISPETSSGLVASQEPNVQKQEVFELDLQTPNEPFIVLPLIGGDEHEIYQPVIDELSLLYPAVDVPQAFRTMRAWLLTNPKERKTKAGIARFYNAWIAKNQDRGTGPAGGGKKIGHKLTEGMWSGFDEKNYREGVNADGSF